jgi:hypothetical protein
MQQVNYGLYNVTKMLEEDAYASVWKNNGGLTESQWTTFSGE